MRKKVFARTSRGNARHKDIHMQTSARNVFKGKVAAVHSGAVNDEVELSVEGGLSIVASITQVSTKKLGLKPGVEAVALIKASFVLLMNDAEKYLLSTRNQFAGTVSKVTPGAVNAEVLVDLPSGKSIASIVTMGSLASLGLAPGKKVTAIVKASQVILAVPK
jgi:molybdate transport system regulatory protein